MSIWRQISKSWSKTIHGGIPKPGTFHAADILDALKAAVKNGKKIFKDKTFVPDKYDIYLSISDLSDLKPLLKPIRDELVEEIRQYIQQKEYKTTSPHITVNFQKRHSLRPGELQVVGRFEEVENEDEYSSILKVYLKVQPKTAHEKIVEIGKGLCTIGRAESADIILSEKDPLLSKTHCQLEVTPKAVYVKDLKSANGTILNRKLIKNVRKLKSGDILLLGNTEVEVTF